MPFDSNNNVEIRIRVEDRDATQRLDRITESLDGLAKEVSGELSSGLRQANNALQNLSTTARTSESSFTRIGASIITLNQGLQLAERAFRFASSAASSLFDTLGEAQRIEGLSTSFNNLQASIGQIGGESIQNLRTATQGLVSDLELFEAANTAVLLGVDTGTGQFDDLAAAAVRLGQATGRTATEALNDLTVGLGRQSKLILDNLGIIVDATKANEEYAAANGLVASSLTDLQSKQAFVEAGTRAILDASSKLAAIQDTAATAATKLSVAVENQSNAFATSLSNNLALNNAINDLAGAVSKVDVTRLARDLGELASIFVKFASVTIPASITALRDFNRGLSIISNAASNFAGNFSRGLDRIQSSLPGFVSELGNRVIEGIITPFEAIASIPERIGLAGSLGSSFTKAATQAAQQGAQAAADEFKSTVDRSFSRIELSGILTDKFTVSTPLLAEVAKSISEIGFATSAFNKLTEEQQVKVLQAEAAFKKFSTQVRQSKEAQDEVASATRKTVSELEKIQGAATSATDAFIRAQRDGVNPFVEEIQSLVDIQQLTGASTEVLQSALEVLQKQLVTTAAEGKDWSEALKIITKDQNSARESAEDFNKGFNELLKDLAKLDPSITAVSDLNKAVQRLIEDFKNGRITAKEFSEAIKNLGKEGKVSSKGLDAAKAAAQELERAARKTKQTLEGFFGTLGADLLKDNAFGKELASFLGTDLGQDVGNEIVGGITSILQGGDIEQALVDGLAGVTAAAGTFLFGPLGGAVGDILGEEVGKNLAIALEGGRGSGIAAAGAALDTIFFGLGTVLAQGIEALDINFEGIDNLIDKVPVLGDGLEALGVSFNGLFGIREDPFRDARLSLQAFIQQLGADSGSSLLSSFRVEDFSEIIRSAEEVQAIFGDTFRDFTTDLGDGTFAVNQFSEELAELGLTADRDLLATFEGIGTGLASLFEDASDNVQEFGQQFGVLLGVNLQDSLGLNELQLSLQAAGISAEDFSLKLQDAFFSGELSAREFQNSTAAVGDLLADGIPGAVGAVDVAFNNLVSGGLASGQKGLDALQDIAFEALELDGISGDTGLEAALTSVGIAGEDATRLLEVLAQQGITTVEALSNIDLSNAASILVALEDVGFGFAEVQDDIEATRTSLQEFRREAEQRIVANVEVNVDVNDPDGGLNTLVENGVDSARAFTGQNVQ